jgi:hypothetical protein
MKRIILCCLFLATPGFVSVSHADTLFEENWNSGTIDPLVWTLSADAVTNNAYVVMDAVNGDPEATGDKALMYVGWGSWQETIESVATYNRDTGGDGLVIEFSTWVEGSNGASAQGFNGPFHNPDATVSFTTIEFGTEWNWPSHQWSEGSMFNGKCRNNPAHAGWPLWHSGDGSVNDNLWQSRFGHSLGKIDNPEILRPDGAMKVRYTLGATQGGRIEWFDTSINEDTDEVVGWVSEGDYRDGTLGSVIPDTTFQQGTSSSPTVRLGWLTLGYPPEHPSGNHPGNGNLVLDMETGIKRDGIFIDDIIVYAGAPTTPPAGACNLTGSCQVLTEAECTTQGGTYDGDDTICVAVFNIPGDCNQDGTLDLSDVVHLLGFLFQGSPADLPCSTEAANLTLMDCNQDGGIDLSDAVYKLAFLFQGGPPPVPGDGCTEMAGCPQNQACP